MSLFRTPSPSSTHKIKTAAVGLALAAAAAGTVGVCSASTAGTADAVGALGTADTVDTLGTAAGTGGPAQTAHQPAVLDVFTARALPAMGSQKRPPGGSHARLTPRQIALRMLHSFQWSGWQFQWLNLLWSRESGWNVYATNSYSGAYGIPQAVPGDKMATAGPDWQSDARTQIRWGLEYIKDRYGSPYEAWEHELATGWY